MKKTAIKKMALRAETVRALSAAQLPAVHGGASSADFTACISDACNTHNQCNSIPPNCAGTQPQTNVRTCANCTVA